MKYPKILSIGDPNLGELFDDPVVVEEKVDGSQFRVWFDAGGQMRCGSKGVSYDDEHPPDKMFLLAIRNAEKHFRGREEELKNVFVVFEYLQTPQQNALTYERVPADNLLVLDVSVGGKWLARREKEEFARTHGFECVSVLYEGKLGQAAEIEHLLQTKSFLGDVDVEGLVVKNYHRFHTGNYLAGAPVFGKYVREEFKELNREVWGQGKTLEERIMEHFPKEQRWEKVVQHLREEGQLQSGVKDIGKLIQAVEEDFAEEAAAFVKEFLWNEYKFALQRKARAGFAEWYKKKLLDGAFSGRS
ncbi:hypothetical protein HZC09_03385 [Candidatus Micrarchaeota archaeon]|nr:hypothetical protein [Candidatus Micrarchaeota archaeon]